MTCQGPLPEVFFEVGKMQPVDKQLNPLLNIFTDGIFPQVFKVGYDVLSMLFTKRADVLMVASYLPRWFEVALSIISGGKV